MRKLAALIETELKEQEVCAVYNSTLARVFPKTINPEKRKKDIERFAKKNQLAVTFYDIGLCAVFEKVRRLAREHELVLPVPLLKQKKPRRPN